MSNSNLTHAHHRAVCIVVEATFDLSILLHRSLHLCSFKNELLRQKVMRTTKSKVLNAITRFIVHTGCIQWQFSTFASKPLYFEICVSLASDHTELIVPFWASLRSPPLSLYNPLPINLLISAAEGPSLSLTQSFRSSLLQNRNDSRGISRFDAKALISRETFFVRESREQANPLSGVAQQVDCHHLTVSERKQRPFIDRIPEKKQGRVISGS